MKKKLKFNVSCTDKELDFILKNEGKMINCLINQMESEYSYIRSLSKMKVDLIGSLFCYQTKTFLKDDGRKQVIEIKEIKQEGKEISFKYDLK